MLDYLKSLKRNDLIKLYANFGTNPEIKKSLMKNKNEALVNSLVDEQVLTIETAKSFLVKDNTKAVEEAKKTADVISNPPVEIESIQSNQEETKDIIIAKRVSNQAQEVRDLANKLKEEAMETLVVKISPISDNDIRTKGKNSEVIMFANQYFSLAKAVPFNVKCELPRCIVKIAQEAVSPVYIPFEDMDTRKKTGRMGVYQLAPKYNVVVYGKANEIIESEKNKKRLGI